MIARLDEYLPFVAEQLRCPRRDCAKPFLAVASEEPFRGALRCLRRTCECRWFVEPLGRGLVRGYLVENYDDVAVAEALIAQLQLPEWIDRPAYLQLPVSGPLWHEYVVGRDGTPRAASLRLLRHALSGIL